jgi:hypothetical protein
MDRFKDDSAGCTALGDNPVAEPFLLAGYLVDPGILY